MRTTIDKAGRVVIPKELRDAVGMRPGSVDVVVDGAGLRLEVVAGDHLQDKQGVLTIAAAADAAAVSDDDVLRLRDAGRR